MLNAIFFGEETIMNDNSGIVVFGIGWLGQQAVRFLKQSNRPIVAIWDDVTDKTEFLDVPVMRSDAFSLEKRKILQLLVAIENCEHPYASLIKRLQDDKWGSVEPYLNFHWRELPSWLWMGSPNIHAGRERDMEQAALLWSDPASRELYYACIKAQQDRNLLVLPPGTPLKRLKQPERFAVVLNSWAFHQIYSYFCEREVGRWSEPLRYLECGAYDGSDLAGAEAAGYDIEAYAGLEPNPVNFSQITRVTRLVPGAQAFPLAASERTQQLRFHMDDLTGCVGKDGEVVQAVSIDDAFFNFRPSLITMDVEGQEAGALRGARETIRAHRPGLAVRVYHRPDDFYVLPMLVKELTAGLGYRYYLRRFLNSMFDMTFYAVPKSCNQAPQGATANP